MGSVEFSTKENYCARQRTLSADLGAQLALVCEYFDLTLYSLHEKKYALVG